MAARENQGLQIGLIIFVTLTVLLSLTTFVFFRNYQNEQQRSKESLKKEGDARQELSTTKDERNQLMQYIGFQAEEKKEVADEAWKKDMAAFQALRAGTLPDDQKNYRKMMDGLQAIIRSQHADLEKQAADLRHAKADFDRKNSDFEAQRKALAEEKDKTVADYMAARDTNEKLVKELETKENELAAALDQKQKDFEARKKQVGHSNRGKRQALPAQKSTLDVQIDAVHKLNSAFSVNTQPNGKILWVNQRDNVAYINLGSDDLLHKRVTFNVYEQNTTDPSAVPSVVEEKKQAIRDLPLDHSMNVAVSEAKTKGTLEVINITGPHLAECRILSDTSSNPMLPGDLIYTPLWRSGFQEHFALAGFLDIDGDGISDLQKVRDIIRTNGGVVDVYTDDEKGTVMPPNGEMTIETRYLVKGRGDRPIGVNQDGFKKLLDQAKDLDVEVINLTKFLDMMGYTPPRIVEKDATGRSVHIPNAGEPTGNFRARTPLDNQ